MGSIRGLDNAMIMVQRLLASALLALIVSVPLARGEPPASVPVTIGQALEVAYRDFESRLEAASRAYKGDLAGCEVCPVIYDIRNYSIGISVNGAMYVVVFRVRKDQMDLIGGGGEYWIRAKDLKVERFEGYE